MTHDTARTSPMTPLSTLKNIGPTIEQRLKAVNIHTQDDLATVGPVEAFQRIRAANPQITIPVCYYLYSLQGALMDLHWNDLPSDLKDTLRTEAGG